MFSRAFRLAAIAASFTAATIGVAQADEAGVRKAVEGFIGSPAVESVTKTPYGGLYEIVLKSGELVYTDEKASFLIDGRIIDTKTRRDVTQARMTPTLGDRLLDAASGPRDQAGPWQR